MTMLNSIFLFSYSGSMFIILDSTIFFAANYGFKFQPLEGFESGVTVLKVKYVQVLY